MQSQVWKYKITILVLALSSFSCAKTNFRGENGRKATAVPPPAETPPGETECKKRDTVVGINVAFLIDNSNSNADTDCPKRQFIGNYKDTNTKQYRCGSAPLRESAVLNSFKYLMDYKNEQGESLDNDFSIASFPTESDIENGGQIRTDGWQNVEGEKEGDISQALQFTRSPMGRTPFAAGLKSGVTLFNQKKGDDKAKLAIFYTDGEPTDDNAAKAKKLAKELKDLGVKVVTVFVTGKQQRDVRIRDHIANLKSFGQSDDNINELLGLNGKTSLIDEMSNVKVEKENHAEIEAVFKGEIKHSLECED